MLFKFVAYNSPENDHKRMRTFADNLDGSNTSPNDIIKIIEFALSGTGFQRHFSHSSIDLINTRNLIQKAGKGLNIKFSFTFLKKDDDYIDHFTLFKLLCPRPYRSVEISNYIEAVKHPIITEEEFFTVHFRSIFNKNNSEWSRDIFPCGNFLQQYTRDVQPMLADVEKLNSKFYRFFDKYLYHINNISVHLGLASNFAIQPRGGDGHSIIDVDHKGYQYSEKDALQIAIETINAFNSNLATRGLGNKLIVENLDYNRDILTCPDGILRILSAYEYFCEPANIYKILTETNTGLLLDIGHAIITVKNFYSNIYDIKNKHNKKDPSLEDMKKYINTACNKDYSLIKEIHFVVPTYSEESINKYEQDANELWHKADCKPAVVSRLLDDHTSFVKLSPTTPKKFYEHGLKKIMRAAEYNLAIESLKFIITERNHLYPDAEPLIINIETAPGSRDIFNELNMIAKELRTILPPQ